MNIPADYHDRASRIVDRVMPLDRAPHGFADPNGFARSCQSSLQRKRLYYHTFAQLRAKAEGGPPRLTLPPRSEHLFGPGNALYDVAKELEREALR